jgi:hypothetical protein
MTVQPSMGNEVAPFDPAEFGNVGMEDVGATDLVIPRLQIVHKEGVFRDNLSKSEYSTLQVILLGLVKQRIMWDEDVEEGDRPQCKSPDFNMGFPQMREDIPKAKQFPWDMSNFSKADFPPEAGVNGLRTLPCSISGRRTLAPASPSRRSVPSSTATRCSTAQMRASRGPRPSLPSSAPGSSRVKTTSAHSCSSSCRCSPRSPS